MRQVTATEKYRAVNEGKIAKGEFVRQMRMAYPSVISQWNSYNDTVTILKNRGYINEKTGVESYDSRYDLNISPNSIDRGVRYELAAQGVDPVEVKDKELVAKVTDRVVKNLKRDPLHYINLLAKESSSTDKHDREEEVKRGEAKKDVFNGEKKADLREGRAGEHPDGTPKSNDEMDDDEKNDFYDNLDSMDEVKDEKQNIIDVASAIRAKYGDIPGFTGLLKDFLQTHMHDVKSGAVTDPIGEFNDFVDLNYDRLDEKEEVNENIDSFSDVIQVVGVENVEDALKVIERYENEFNDGPVSVDQAKELVADLRATDEDEYDKNITNLIVKAFNIKLKGISEKKGKDHDGDGDIDSDDYMAAKDKAIKKAMGKDVNEMSPEMSDIVAFLATGAGIQGASHVAGKLLAALENGRFGEKGKEIAQDIHNLAKTDVEEKTSIDLKESVKNIITKVLEEQMINEAATNELARLAEDYEEFPGMKQSIIALQDIVTDIESFYDKTREKIQKVYDSIGEIRNEEGLKVGGFLAPTIETAFNKDLRPIAKKGFTKGLETPKVKSISSAEIDAARERGEIEEEPKNTVFTPINEKVLNEDSDLEEFKELLADPELGYQEAFPFIEKYSIESLHSAYRLGQDLRGYDLDEFFEALEQDELPVKVFRLLKKK